MVTVNAAGVSAFRVIKVHAAQIPEADDAIELGEGRLAVRFATQIVAPGKGVAGIDADADARFILYAVDDRRQMLEAVAEIAALTGGVFNHSGNAAGLIQRDIHRFRDALQTGFLVNLIQMAAGMKIEQRQAQLFAAL